MTGTPLVRPDLGHLYDKIGDGYSVYRRPDPRIARAIRAALDDARTVINVGAGTGSYEPADRAVTAIEPSTAMARQRGPRRPAAVLGVAESLPVADKTADAAMAVLTMQHWADVSRGLSEMRRVARNRIVLVTVDVAVEADMWLLRDYVPEVAARDRDEFPAIERLVAELNLPTQVITVPVPSDCQDGFLLAFWSRPEAVLDPAARAATSGFARLDAAVEAAAVSRLGDDLQTGAWDDRHRRLRALPEMDVGLRMVIADVRETATP